jgi:putative acetyltransferase
MSAAHHSTEISVRTALSDTDLASLRGLFLRYQHSLSLDLAFQDFEAELASLPGAYAPPHGGAFLARIDAVDGGCCAFRAITDVDYPNACEMKRLYVDPVFRGFGLGQLLIEHTMLEAKAAGYAYMLLDTLDDMQAARSLYHEAGFFEVAPYYYNPLPGTHYLAAEL